MRAIDVHKRLMDAVKTLTVPESRLKLNMESSGIDFGKNIKTRLNYLVSLGILHVPEPIYYGKGKGGTRLFQKDILEILEFVDQERANNSFNEIAGIINERRVDLTRQACRELQIEDHLPDSKDFIKSSIIYTISRCLFSFTLIKSSVVCAKILKLIEFTDGLEGEMKTLSSFKSEIGITMCNRDKNKTSQYISKKQNLLWELLEILDDTVNEAESLIKVIEDNR
jgi:hypothetical protein